MSSLLGENTQDTTVEIGNTANRNRVADNCNRNKDHRMNTESNY